MKTGTKIAGMLEHERWDRVFSAVCIGIPWQLRPHQRNLSKLVVFEAEADQGVAPVIVLPAAPRTDRRRYVTKKSRVRKPEKRCTLADRRWWKINNQFNSQLPQFEWVDHRVHKTEPDQVQEQMKRTQMMIVKRNVSDSLEPRPEEASRRRGRIGSEGGRTTS